MPASLGRRGSDGPAAARALRGAAAALVAAAAALMLFGATSAFAAYTARTPLPVGGVGFPSSVAVDQSTGDVYANNPGFSFGLQKGKVFRFDSSGTEQPCALSTPATPAYPAGLGIDPFSGRLYVLDVTSSGSGIRLRTFGANCGAEEHEFAIETSKVYPNLGADEVGHVLVPNGKAGALEECTAEGVCTTLIGGIANPSAAVFDAAGNIYVSYGAASGTSCANGKLGVWEADGTPIDTDLIESHLVTTVAIDRGSGDIFVGRGCDGGFQVEKYDSSLSLLTTFGAGLFARNAANTNYNQLAVDETSGRVYVVDSAAKQVQVFEPAPSHPLTVAIVENGGTGTVTGPGISCEPDCEGAPEEGDEVTLTAHPPGGSALAEWKNGSGDAAACNGLATKTCSFTVTGPASIEAEFIVGGEALTVVKGGSGEGTVSSQPAGIECGPECVEETAYFDEGEGVELTASAAAHSDFSGWTGLAGDPGTCTGTTSPCEVTMSEAVELEAAFTRRTRTLEVQASGAGAVSAAEPPAPVSGSISGCEEATCEAVYEEGRTVTLLASPAPNHEALWSGCTPVPGHPDECALEIPEADAAVTVSFELEKRLLTVQAKGGGEGTVSGGSPSNPATIDCGSAGSECSFEYDHGETVTLLATPEGAESELKSWSGCNAVLGPEGEECEVAMTAAKTVVATFAAGAFYELAVEKEGSGTGTVTSSPAGIACGAECSAEFEEEKTIALAGAPGPDSGPVVWSGCTEVTEDSQFDKDNLCKVKMSEAKTVGASFDLIARTLTVNPVDSAGGSGTVSAAAGAISGCKVGGGVCSGAYGQGTTVILTASPSTHSQVAWSGCTASAGNTCEVQMPAAGKSVGAVFTSKTHSLALYTGSGTGSGHVDCNGSPCIGAYPEGTTLELEAVPDPHSAFAGFGAGTGAAAACAGAGPCTIVLEEDATVQAPFERLQAILAVTPLGPGTVTASSGPISGCTESGGIGSVCSGVYDAGRKLILTAHAGADHRVQWGAGQCLSNPTPDQCLVEVPDEGADVTALFLPIPIEDDTSIAPSSEDPPSTLLEPKSSPPPSPAGIAFAPAKVPVKGRVALVRLSCRGGGACKGVLKLFARLPAGKGDKGAKRRHRRSKVALIGRAPFRLAAGATKTVRVKIANRGARRLLGRGGRLRATVGGGGVERRAVSLRKSGAKRRGGRRGHPGRR